MTKVNSNGDTENHVHNFDYYLVIGRSDGPMIDLENCDRFRTLIHIHSLHLVSAIRVLSKKSKTKEFDQVYKSIKKSFISY